MRRDEISSFVFNQFFFLPTPQDMLKFASTAVNTFLLAGTTLLLILVVMSGSTDSFPINRFYWVQADTSNIPNAPSTSRWTFWGVCELGRDGNNNCPSLGPAYPFSPVDNFGSNSNVPSSFVDSRDTYYYLSRFAFALILIALVFTGVSFICSIFAYCWKSARHVMVLFVTLALLLDAAGVSCQTAAIALGRNAFHSENLASSLGSDMLGMAWASVACLILIFLICCYTGMRRGFQMRRARTEEERQEQAAFEQKQSVYLPPPEPQPLGPPSESGGIKFFKIRRNKAESDTE